MVMLVCFVLASYMLAWEPKQLNNRRKPPGLHKLWCHQARNAAVMDSPRHLKGAMPPLLKTIVLLSNELFTVTVTINGLYHYIILF